MDSSFVNYDGRSVHDMIEILQAASGDPEAVARLQASINAVDAKFGPVNTELARLETDKQDAGDYALNGIGGNIAYPDGAGMGQFISGGNWAGMTFRGNPTVGEQNPYNQEVVIYNWNTQKITHARYNNINSQWENKSVWTADYDSGNVQITGEYMNFTVRRIKDMVWLTYASALKKAIPVSQASQTDVVLATLPVGFRPLNNSAAIVSNNTADKFGMCLITGNGNVVIRSENGFDNETVLVNNMFFTSNAIPTT